MTSRPRLFLRYRIVDLLALFTVVSLVIVVFQQRQQSIKLLDVAQQLRTTLDFETTVLVEYGRYLLFRLKDETMIIVKISPQRKSADGEFSNCHSYKWAVVPQSALTSNATSEQLANASIAMANPDETQASGEGSLGEGYGDRLNAGPLSIGWSKRSANSGWLALHDAKGVSLYMYTEQLKTLEGITLSPYQWRPVYWSRESPHIHDQGWDSFGEPNDLMSKWEQESVVGTDRQRRAGEKAAAEE